MGMRDTLNNLDKANWRKEENWGAVRVSDGSQGLRFSLETLSEKEREEFKAELKRLDINFHERTATQSGPAVSAGDLTIRILDPNSLNKLKSSVFAKAENSDAFWDNWAEKGNSAFKEEKQDAWIDKFWENYDSRIKNKELEYISPWDAFVSRLNIDNKYISDEQAMEMFSRAHARAKDASFKDPNGNSLKTSEWTDANKNSLLIHMIQLGRNNIAKRLINEFYADVKYANKDGLTPLHAAAQKGSMEMCQVLRREGANPLAEVKETGLMPYEIAKENGHEEVAKYLFKEAQNKKLFQIGLKQGYMNR